jgi:type I restriction enzyme, R subunit
LKGQEAGMSIAESDVEEATLEWFEQLEYTRLHGSEVSPGGKFEDRAGYDEVILRERLRTAIQFLNPYLSEDAVEEVYRRVTRIDHPDLTVRNQQFHKILVEGVTVENRRIDGSLRHELARVIDFERFEKNDWLVVNQFTVIENGRERRPDVVVFVNGLPLVVIELKNIASEKATIRAAFQQLQTYKQQIPSLLTYNEVLVVSDGREARAGTLTADWERFQPWRTVDGVTIAPKGRSELETLLLGICEKKRFLDLLYSFIVFESDGATISKKMAAYHQFHAVNKAVATTVKACSKDGDQRAGVIWHTQGSGKSLTMVFYAGKIIQQAEMANPTLVILTDRNDLDDQLFGTFSRCQDVLRQKPVQAEEREDIERFLKDRAAGGVIFTTIQKFFPEEGAEYKTLSERRNIVFIADEAHRSQYGLDMHVVKDRKTNEDRITYGFAKYLRDALPNASFIGFTGTPIESKDKDTRAIFGDYIDTYDIYRSVEDGATVRIYYEARTVPLKLDEGERPQIDPRFEEVTEGRELEEKEKLKSKWGRLEALVGAQDRLEKIAADIVKHFEQRQEVLEGKGMIVCMSRRICVELYDEIIKLRPQWHYSDDDKGEIKVVMTGNASDETFMQPHIRPKKKREAIAKRFKDAADPLKLVIVRDMWLTGFDVPCLHTMYLDKPMEGHGLMQAIARVNRVFKDKPGGLIVDYLGLAQDLKAALHEYSRADQSETGIEQEKAVEVMQEKYEVVQALFHGFDYSDFFGDKATVRISVIPAAMDHLLALEDGKRRYMRAVTALFQAYRLSMPHPRAVELRNEIGFFMAVRANFIKATPMDGRMQEDLDAAVGQIVSQAITAGGVIDMYDVLGVKNPNVALLSDEFLEEMSKLPHKRLAFEVLEKLLNDEIRTRFRSNVVKTQSFEARLEEAVKLYQDRAIEAAIAMLQANARAIRDTLFEDDQLGLGKEALAYYDALKEDSSAVKNLEDKKLQAIARELVDVVRDNISIDWTIRERARADLRRMVSRCLRKNGYPLVNQQPEPVVELIIKQAEALSKDWNVA